MANQERTDRDGADHMSDFDAKSLEWTLDNIYTIARREIRRLDRLNAGPVSAKEPWGHVLRLCEKAGRQPRDVLRDNGGSV